MAAAPATLCETPANVLAYGVTDCDVHFTSRLTESAETIRATTPCALSMRRARRGSARSTSASPRTRSIRLASIAVRAMTCPSRRCPLGKESSAR